MQLMAAASLFLLHGPVKIQEPFMALRPALLPKLAIVNSAHLPFNPPPPSSPLFTLCACILHFGSLSVHSETFIAFAFVDELRKIATQVKKDEFSLISHKKVQCQIILKQKYGKLKR